MLESSFWWAHNSAGECYLHTVEVVGSIPTAPTRNYSSRSHRRRSRPYQNLHHGRRPEGCGGGCEGVSVETGGRERTLDLTSPDLLAGGRLVWTGGAGRVRTGAGVRLTVITAS